MYNGDYVMDKWCISWDEHGMALDGLSSQSVCPVQSSQPWKSTGRHCLSALAACVSSLPRVAHEYSAWPLCLYLPARPPSPSPSPSQSEPSGVLLECAPSNFRRTLVVCTHRLPLCTNYYSLTSTISPAVIDNRRRISSEDRKAGASQGRSIEAQTIVRQA